MIAKSHCVIGVKDITTSPPNMLLVTVARKRFVFHYIVQTFKHDCSAALDIFLSVHWAHQLFGTFKCGPWTSWWQAQGFSTNISSVNLSGSDCFNLAWCYIKFKVQKCRGVEVSGVCFSTNSLDWHIITTAAKIILVSISFLSHFLVINVRLTLSYCIQYHSLLFNYPYRTFFLIFFVFIFKLTAEVDAFL